VLKLTMSGAVPLFGARSRRPLRSRSAWPPSATEGHDVAQLADPLAIPRSRLFGDLHPRAAFKLSGAAPRLAFAPAEVASAPAPRAPGRLHPPAAFS
jgi:hypothetical protein